MITKALVAIIVAFGLLFATSNMPYVNEVSESPIAKPNCCIKHAYCCVVKRPCCNHGSTGVTASEAVSSPRSVAVDDEVAKPNCCIKKAYCCVVKRPCCHHASSSEVVT